MTAATTDISERPLLLGGEWVRAILAGHKTQTRRPILADVGPYGVKPFSWTPDGTERWKLGPVTFPDGTGGPIIRCPLGVRGDRLWVRETWQPAKDGFTSEIVAVYKADWEANGRSDGPLDGRWRPSIHMPRWASRLTLEITSIRAERLRRITEADALAEGLRPSGGERRVTWGARSAYRIAWDGTYPDRPWSANPWVWVCTFRRVDN